MPDANIKKVRIPKSSLPPINSDTLGYNLRYRIISEDKNRTSHWSPVYNTDGISISETSGALSITQTIITAVWGDQNKHPSYDIFVSFDGDPFYWHGTSAVHSYSFLNEGSTTVRVKVQLVSSKKAIKAALNIFDSGTESLV
jgi:hypothetical protein